MQRLSSLNKVTAFDIDRFCEYFSDRIQNADPGEKVAVIKELDIRALAYPGRKYEVYWPFDGFITTVRFPDEIVYVTHKPVSMRPEVKKAFDQYCQDNNILPSELLRKALREAPKIKTKLTPAIRCKRYRSTVFLTEDEWKKLKNIKEKGGQSFSRSMEWALEQFLKC